jgi:Flp pilus assembly pilin Flp
MNGLSVAPEEQPNGQAMIRHLKNSVSFLRQEEGVTSLEYAVMLSLICGAIISSVGVLSMAMRDSFNRSGNAVNSVLGGPP